MSPNDPLYARTVIEEPPVTEKIELVRKVYPRLQDIIDAVKWRLARQPEAGVQIPGTNPERYILKTWDHGRKEIPIVTVIYRYDDNTVCLERIKFQDPSELTP